MKIVIAGSPQISVDAFNEIINSFEVVAIVTQPDAKKGRGMLLQQTPVADLADKYKIKVFKPKKIIDIKDELNELDFDIFVTFAYGQWIPSDILSIGKFKPVNIHGSLLPKYRGAAPIHQAILNGDNEIGITLIEMIKKMDAGDMFFKAKKNIDENTTTGEAFEIISSLAKENIVNWLKMIEEESIIPEKQGNEFSIAPKIEKQFGDLSGLKMDKAIRKIRGLNPYPGAFILMNNKRLKIYDIQFKEGNGTIKLKFSDGFLYANDYQWESKKRFSTK